MRRLQQVQYQVKQKPHTTLALFHGEIPKGRESDLALTTQVHLCALNSCGKAETSNQYLCFSLRKYPGKQIRSRADNFFLTICWNRSWRKFLHSILCDTREQPAMLAGNWLFFISLQIFHITKKILYAQCNIPESLDEAEVQTRAYFTF